MTSPETIAPTPCPIVIQGVTYRSGTNFLFDLLTQHPDCGFGPPYENFFLAYTHLLNQYVDGFSNHWDPAWGAQPARFKAALGWGLLHPLIQAVAPKRLVTKTPNVDGLENYLDFFPGTKLLILVRDGRAVVESSVRSFHINREVITRDWAYAADLISRFIKSHPNSNAWLLVRYEDLVNDLEKELHRIFDFLQLDSNAYNFSAAKNLPIRGSSDLAVNNQLLHWEPVANYTSFEPNKRWENWSLKQHTRFNWLAGQQMQALGYTLVPAPSARLARLQNRILDWQYLIHTRLRQK